MAAVQRTKQLTGVVVSAGKMMKTVKVQVPKQKWNRRIQKYYATPYNVLVSDPTETVREGDIVSIKAGIRASKHVKHYVASIVAPMGPPLSQRPPLPTEAERFAAIEAKRAEKDERQAARGRYPAIQRVQERERVRDEEELAALVPLQATVKRLREDQSQVLRKQKEAETVEAAEWDSLASAIYQAQEHELKARSEGLKENQEYTGSKSLRVLTVPHTLTRLLSYAETKLQDSQLPSNERAKYESRKQLIQNDIAALEAPMALEQRKEYENITLRDRMLDADFIPSLEEYLLMTAAESEEARRTHSTLVSSLESNKVRGQSQFGLDQEVEKKMLDLALHRLSRIIADGEVRQKSVQSYIDSVRGDENEFAENALKWEILTMEHNLSEEEKMSAALALSKIPSAVLGEHINQYVAQLSTSQEASTQDNQPKAKSKPKLKSRRKSTGNAGAKQAGPTSESGTGSGEKKGLRGWLGI